MSAAILREAAALMRERAEAATATPWAVEREPGLGYVIAADESWVCEVGDLEGAQEDAQHIASWHPAVALAVADWLDDFANNNLAWSEMPGAGPIDPDCEALKVATTYLGRTS